MASKTYPPGATTKRGYGATHQRLRRAYARKVAAGGVDCWRCGEPIPPGSEWHLGHDDHNRRRYRGPECVPCNTATSSRRPAFSGANGAPDDRRRQFLSPPSSDDLDIRDSLCWAPDVLARYDWLVPFLEVPFDAAPPLAMSRPPADAQGSYGEEAIEWIERTQRITLRWWQRLAIVRQLEFRADGTLCHRTIVESTPRRAGKSVRLRGVALWRMANAELLGETQTLVHTGSDVAICREIQRGAWRWCEEQAGWSVSRANGKEAVETPDGDRWLVRAQRAVYGYDVCFGMVDEGWDVAPDTVTEGLEPALLERKSPQLHLTSTAHRRATSLMRTALGTALAVDNPETLLLLWGARPGCDISDPGVWKAASPYWSDDRRKMIADKLDKALSGQNDPEDDDPDPLRGFEAQYLNVWRLRETLKSVGDPVVSKDEWGELVTEIPGRAPDAVAIEDWFTEGASVALAWREGKRAVVSLTVHADLAGAAEAVGESGFTGAVLVGASIVGDPVWDAASIRTTARKGSVRAAVEGLSRLLTEGALSHDGSSELAEQVLALRTSPGVDGPRVRSTAPADAVKAAVWAAVAAREQETYPRVMMV